MTYRPLWLGQVRNRESSRNPAGRRSTPVRLGRRGVDPVEIAEFPDQAAGDPARAYDELARTREQNMPVTDALRRWRSRRTASAYELVGR
ncbi:DivIVA domain-containing protein [Plantactinospora solaniradicis]|uniref:DivIVA domain-containing protein n=1 Tax=Plantactinospora solaniradicis TaxID=1723736 RepID=A0ABW1K707_9ACTN